jgi:hypothetical protein
MPYRSGVRYAVCARYNLPSHLDGRFIQPIDFGLPKGSCAYPDGSDNWILVKMEEKPKPGWSFRLFALIVFMFECYR